MHIFLPSFYISIHFNIIPISFIFHHIFHPSLKTSSLISILISISFHLHSYFITYLFHPAFKTSSLISSSFQRNSIFIHLVIIFHHIFQPSFKTSSLISSFIRFVIHHLSTLSFHYHNCRTHTLFSTKQASKFIVSMKGYFISCN